MDVQKALRELYGEKKRLDRAILDLEAKLKSTARRAEQKTSPRGRRSMNIAERREVSRRMTAYWTAKKAAMSTGKVLPEPSAPAVEVSQASA